MRSRRPPFAPEPVADVVADDRGDRGEDDHRDDVEVPGRGQDAGGDEHRLARERDARRLEHDHEEENDEPVALQEVHHESQP